MRSRQQSHLVTSGILGGLLGLLALGFVWPPLPVIGLLLAFSYAVLYEFVRHGF